MTLFETVVFLVIVSIPALALGYLMLASTLGSSAASKQIQRTLVILLAGFPIVVLAFILLPPLSVESIYRMLIMGFALFTIIGLPILYFREKRRSGDCLLYIGRTRMHKIRLVLGAVLLVSGALIGITSYFDGEFDLDLSYSLLNGLSLGFLAVFVGFVPIQVTERGLLELTLLPWKNVQDYRWEEDHTNTLTLTFKRRGFSSLFKHASFPIPPQHKSALDEILRQYIVEETPEAIPSIP